MLLVIWSYIVIGTQINSGTFIQCNEDTGYIMQMSNCFILIVGYCVCSVPIIYCWIKNGFRQDNYL